MKSFYLTDVGKVRDHNEDNVVIVKNKNDEYLMAVADGMGGHSAGEVASSLAIDYIVNSFNDNFNLLDKVEAVNWLREKVIRINELIFEYVNKHPESKGMGTTLVIALITKTYILFGNIGDSSGFVLKDGHLHKVTYDQTLVNLLMKALGANDPIDIDIFDCDMNISSILLSSDGLTNMLEQDQIEEVLNSELELEDKVIKLIRKCNNRGGTDNISIAYLSFEESGE